MQAKSYLRALLPLAALSFASLTQADTVRTLKADGSQNNANIYSSRQEVWIGVQDGTSFEKDGIYFFGVTIPSSSAATSLLSNDGVANSDARYTVQTTGNGQSAVSTPVAPNLGSNPADPWGWLSRIMIVENGKITAATAHAVQPDPRNNGGNIVQLWPYAPSNNNEYKIWMVHIDQVTVKYRISPDPTVQTTSAADYATNIASNPNAVLLQATYPNSKGTSTDNFKVIVQATNTLQILCPASRNISVCPSVLGANVTLGNATATGLGAGGTFVLDSITFTNTDTQVPVTVPYNSTTGQHFFPVGSTTVTISGHDSSAPSSTASCSFFIVVEATDVDAPVPSIANIDVTGQCSVTVTAPTATDNCSSSLITGTTTDPLTYTAQGVYQITWTYTDASGNTSTQKQTVTVNDTIKPVPSVATLAPATGVCSVTLVAPTATDNCATGLITGTTSQLTFTGETDTTVTWTYNDGHGNTTTQTQRVIVHDDVAPTISAPSSFEVNTDAGACSAVVTFDWNAGDNCSLKSSSINIPSGSSFPKGATTVTIKAEDAAGNKSTKSFVVTVVDNQAPVAPTLSPITGECSASAPAPKAPDNCDGNVTGVPNGPTSFNVEGTYTIIWTFTDAAGNFSTASQTVTVTDKTASVSGKLFNDHNTPNAVQDAGDPGLSGWTVTLKQGATTVATTTSLSDGSYSFTGLHSGTYTAVVTVPASWTGTTPSSNTVTVSCGGTASFNYGCYTLGAGGALSKGFWTNKNGQAVFVANGPTTGTANIAKLGTYALRDSKGALVNLTSYSAVSSFLNNATATNMVNMLSAQLAAVVLDIEVGNQVAGAKYLLGCNGGKLVSLVNGTANNGNAAFTSAIQAAFPDGNFATIDAVVAKAQALLLANNPADVATQTAVKNVLDAICNNTNFVQ